MITDNKDHNLKLKMERLGLHEKDIKEKFIRSSGKGGQNVNKTSSCVWIKHEPTGTEVKCQKTRSQQDNRYFARVILCEKIETKVLGKKSAAARKHYKIKKQKQKRSKRAKEKMLREKKKRSEKKEHRQRPSY